MVAASYARHIDTSIATSLQMLQPYISMDPPRVHVCMACTILSKVGIVGGWSSRRAARATARRAACCISNQLLATAPLLSETEESVLRRVRTTLRSEIGFAWWCKRRFGRRPREVPGAAQ